VFFRKTALNPSLAWSPDAKTKVVIKARMLDNTTVDFSGLPRASANSHEPAAGLSRSTFVTATGLPDTTQKSHGLNVQWTQVLNDGWTFKALAAHNTAEVDQRGVFPGGWSLMLRPTYGMPYGSNLPLAGVRLWEKLTSDTLQLSLATAVKTGSALHRLSFGLDRDETSDDAFLAFANLPFVMTDLTSNVRPAWGEPAVPAAADQQRNRSTSTVFYVQDQIQMGALHLHGSLRHTRTEAKRYPDGGVSSQSTNNKVTPRLGAVYDASDVVSFFGGYSEMARVPFGSLFTTAPKMEEAVQKELGVRIKGWNGLSATAALFDIQRKNAAVAHPTIPFRSAQTGLQQAKGLDLDLRWQATPSLAWIAAYTHQTAEITQDTTANLVGKRLFNVPEQTLRVAARYDVRQGDWRGLGLGLGATHRSSLAGDTSNTFFTPAVTLVDAQASYKRGSMRYSASLTNLLNKQYFAPMAYFGGGQVVPGMPRSLVVGVSTHF
jgi:iron complex outermembrane receptor protein